MFLDVVDIFCSANRAPDKLTHLSTFLDGFDNLIAGAGWRPVLLPRVSVGLFLISWILRGVVIVRFLLIFKQIGHAFASRFVLVGRGDGFLFEHYSVSNGGLGLSNTVETFDLSPTLQILVL